MGAAGEIFEKRGASPRMYRNMLVFLAVDKTLMASLEQEVRISSPGSMSFYLSTRLDTMRVNRDVQKILEEVVSVLTQEDGVTVELHFDVRAAAPRGLQAGTIRAVSKNCRTLKIDNFGFEEEQGAARSHAPAEQHKEREAGEAVSPPFPARP